MTETCCIPDPAVPVVLLRTSASQDYTPIPYALVELTPAFCQQALDRIALVGRLKAEDGRDFPALYALEYWDTRPWWVLQPGRDPEPDEGVELDDPAVVEALFEDVDLGGSVLLDPGKCPFAIRDYDASVLESIECTTIHVTEDDITWETILKHSDVHVTTAPLTVADLQEALAKTKGEEPTWSPR